MTASQLKAVQLLTASQPSPNPVMGHPFKHRILGTVSLDSPFLGLHPGIIVSGIASLFRKDEEQSQQPGYPNATTLQPDPSGSLSPDPSIYNELTSSQSGLTSPSTLTTVSSASSPPPGGQSQLDPLFNPPYFNDVLFRDRGWWKNVAHFTKKHRSEGIFNSAANHIISHLEFGSCLADYPALNVRYNRLRHLEDVDDFNSANSAGPRREAQVRFVNYFTISTGRLKKKEPPKSPPRSPIKPSSPYLRPQDAESRKSTDGSSQGSTPRISIEDHSDDGRPRSLQYISPEDIEPMLDEEEAAATVDAGKQTPETGDADLSAKSADVVDGHAQDSLPRIPDLPEPPQPPNLDQYSDKEERKQAEKEAKRVQKAYEQVVKNREKAIKERQKLVEKRRKQTLKDAEKKAKEEKKRLQKEERAEQAALQKEISELNLAALNNDKPSSSNLATTQETTATPAKEKEKKKKERKFCMLPMKPPNGKRDETWVRIDMEGVDEVGAHCGLFFPGPHYDKLVGDVGSRIVSWVQEDASKRTIMALD